VKLARIVSVGLRLTMINNSDQNEGYWEAARISVQPSDFTVDAVTGALCREQCETIKWESPWDYVLPPTKSVKT
jgi:hypothetical protein